MPPSSPRFLPHNIEAPLRFSLTPVTTHGCVRPKRGRVPTILLLAGGDHLADDLRRAGCTVLEVDDATQAITIAAGHRPDAIVLSVHFDTHGAFLTAAMLRFDRATAEVPLVCVLDSAENVEAALATGCAAALVRPITASQIVNTLRGLM